MQLNVQGNQAVQMIKNASLSFIMRFLTMLVQKDELEKKPREGAIIPDITSAHARFEKAPFLMTDLYRTDGCNELFQTIWWTQIFDLVNKRLLTVSGTPHEPHARFGSAGNTDAG